LLGELLLAVRTVYVIPDYSLLPIARKVSKRPDEVLSVLLHNPTPVWRIWLPLLSWLLPRAHSLPDSARGHIAELMRVWQHSAPIQFPFKREIAALAFEWLSRIEHEHYGEVARRANL